MKKILASIAVVGLALVSSFVNAQSNPFQGFNAGVSISSVGANTNISGGGVNLNAGEQSAVPTVEIGYITPASNQFALGISATYDLADTKAGSLSGDGVGVDLKLKNHFSVNLKPGYVIDNAMVYAIVGYNRGSGTVTADGTSVSHSFNGVGYGAGAAIMLNKNIFVKAEVQQISYSSYTTDGVSFKPSATVGTIGINYKF